MPAARLYDVGRGDGGGVAGQLHAPTAAVWAKSDAAGRGSLVGLPGSRGAHGVLSDVKARSPPALSVDAKQ